MSFTVESRRICTPRTRASRDSRLTAQGLRVAEVTDSGLFHGLITRTYHWSSRLGAQSFIDVALTQSNHRLLDEEVRDRLFQAVATLIAAHGGEVTIPHATFLLLARVGGGGGDT